MRINKYLAQCNISSRRKVEEFITSGKVMINDVVVTDLSTQVLSTDIVKFNGVVVKPSNVKLYFKDENCYSVKYVKNDIFCNFALPFGEYGFYLKNIYK